MKSLYFTVLGCVICLGTIPFSTFADRILVMSPIGSKSHKNVFDPLVEALAAKGHQVYSVMPYKTSKLHPNVVKEIVPAGSKNMMDAIPDAFELRRRGKLSGMLFNMTDLMNICDRVHADQEFQVMTRNQAYDLVITNGFFNCFDCVIYKLKAPHVAVTSMAAPSPIARFTGNHLPLSFVPNNFLGFTDRMSFGERLLNSGIELLVSTFIMSTWLNRAEEIYRHHLGQDCPGVLEINSNISLLLMNSYFSLTYPRPNLPDNVEVGGMHCRPAKPLPKDLDEFLSGAEHGFIFFSLGSIVQAQNMPEPTRKVFINVFSKLKQRVIWKWEGNMTDLPPNVRISKWLPQQDILGHPNIRAFITHGGLLSTQESVYHGVPVLGLPLFADQDLNMNQAEDQGYALTAEILELDGANFESKLRRILDEPKFYQRAKDLSSIFRDQLQTPVERAVFWVEYILRHKGAPHLRSAARELNYFQAKSFDVLGVFLAAAILLIWLIVWICKFVFRRLARFLRFCLNGRNKDAQGQRSKSVKKLN